MPIALLDALRAHGRVLAGFAPRSGNHGLHVAIGLVVAGDVTGTAEWLDEGTTRVADMLAASVDDEGVTDEGAVGYQLANWSWYRGARKRLEVTGAPVPRGFERVDLMPELLAHATSPLGRYVPIGDSDPMTAHPIPGTVAEFAATAGERGPRPETVCRVFRAGYVFGRSG